MSQCVPSWDLEDINLNHDVFKLDYEVAELTWENGQLAMHELGPRRVPTKSHTTTSWDKPRAVETLEAIVNQATHQPYSKSNVAVDEQERVTWLNNKTPTTGTGTAGSLNASAMMTSDALVPSNHKRTGERSAQTAHWSIKSAREGGCSTRVGSCSGNPSAFMDPRVAHGGGGTTAAAHDWSSCRSETFGTRDTYDYDLDARRLASTSTGSPENTSSVDRDCSKSTLPDDSPCHCTAQREANTVKEKKRGKSKSSILNKRRTAAIHNQSERKRRDKINQKMTTLQKLIPNSNKTDKASMLDEVIEYVKQLQSQLHMVNKMNMSPMMMQLAMQQQMQMSMMNSMGLGLGMGMGSMDMNSIGLSNGLQPSTFMHMPQWATHANDRLVNTTAIPTNPMSAFFATQSQPVNMDYNSRMAALYQHMQNQSSAPLRKNY